MTGWFLVLLICPGSSSLIGCSAVVIPQPYVNQQACEEAAKQSTKDKWWCVKYNT